MHTKTPATLSLRMRTDDHACAGIYRLIEGQLINEYPIWKLDGGERWLFSSLELRAWMVGGPDEQAVRFACDDSYITSGVTHDGKMPNDVHEWLRDGALEEWTPDPDIVFHEELLATPRRNWNSSIP